MLINNDQACRLEKVTIGNETVLVPFDINGPYAWDFEQIEELQKQLKRALEILDSERIEELNQFIETNETSQKNRKIKRNKVPGRVYLLKADNGLYKIGYSKNVQARIKQIQKNTPHSIEIVCSIETDEVRMLEGKLHDKYRAALTKYEWFLLSPDQVDEIKVLSNKE